MKKNEKSLEYFKRKENIYKKINEKIKQEEGRYLKRKREIKKW